MDKYTVDLDKVLNDFEYSELTDNLNTNRTYLAQGTSNYASSSKSRSGDAKHSITNVFHSLNEYLNTDISINPKRVNAAVVDNNKENVVQNSILYSDDAREPVDDFEVKTGNLLDLNFTEELPIFKHEEIAQTLDIQIEPKETVSENRDDNDLQLTSEVTFEEHNLKQATLNPTVEVQSEICRLDPILTDEHNLEEDFNSIKEVFSEDDSDVEISDEAPTNVINANIEGDSHLSNDDGTENDSKITKSVTTDERIEEETTIVKYDDTIEIDDSTLNKFLEDLEVEFESENTDPKANVQSEPPDVVFEERKIEDEVVTITLDSIVKEIKEVVADEDVVGDAVEDAVEDVVENAVEGAVEDVIEDVTEKCGNLEESVERPSMLRLPSASDDEAKKREINLIGEPGSTPYNNIYVSKELSLQNEKDVAPKEKESSVSPTFSEASTDTVSDSSDAEMDQNIASTDTGNNLKERGIQHEELVTKLEGEQTTQSEESNVTDVNEENVLPQPENSVSGNDPVYWLGKQAPLWIPDSEALSCLHCDTRFTVIKRRHHCRACGLVLCSKCCNLKYRLEYLDTEARVCLKCYGILNRDSSSSEVSPSAGNSPNRQPNPNNPMEYCSVVPPLQQVGAVSQNPPTVMVPVGVLKRKGSNKKSNKSVMFCDGIRPGSDLTQLDTEFDAPANKNTNADNRSVKTKGDTPKVHTETLSFVPKNSTELPPLVTVCKSETTYFCNKYKNDGELLDLLKAEKLTFALQKNIFVHVKIIELSCCINKKVWCFSTEGFLSVGQDEIVYLIEFLENETCLPIDIFNHLNIIYNDALKGTTVSELGISLHDTSTFLDFKNHAGFLYIRPTFQCVQNILRPDESYLIGLLIHRWETPWAKIFPLRLVLRLGAEYRYYPSPLISTRYRDSLFVELGHTIITIFADFRNFSYTLPNIRGLTIHMEDKNTTVNIPVNRYDQVMSSLNNSSDHILALGGNFSTQADSHLVCIQDTQSSTENAYTTHAINIQNRPRKVTGASFIVFNGALKSTSGLTAKSSIVEDGLMIQIPPEDMVNLRESLRNMKNFTIQCGCVNAPSDETVNINWGDMDNNFNIGVISPIDNQSLSGVPSIRVHNAKNYTGPTHSKMIRWTEVFILQNTDEKSKAGDPLDISKISENIAKATCTALVRYLDLLCSNNFFKIGIRTTLHVENVSYSAGSNNVKLPPIYMKSLDNELIPVLHRIVSNNLGDDVVTLELIFRILNS